MLLFTIISLALLIAFTAWASSIRGTIPALWKEVSIEEFPEWRQPLGSEDAYHLGDKVSHNDKHWISTVDNNTWEPGVYGWDEQS